MSPDDEQNKTQCEVCGHFDENGPRPYTGVCYLTGRVVDVKETCWDHTDKKKEKEKAPL